MLKINEDISITLNRELDPFERLIEQAQKPLPPQEFTLTETFTPCLTSLRINQIARTISTGMEAISPSTIQSWGGKKPPGEI
jgi:hypothetical protein